MPGPGAGTMEGQQLTSELYLLIHSFLANGPFSRAADALREDLEEQQRDALSAGSVPALAPRFDWLGAPHVKALDQAGPASPDLLPKLLCRLSELSEQYIPGPAPGIRTFIGTTDASSLLRTRSIAKERRFAHSEFNLSGVFRSQLANAPKLGPLAGVVDIGAGRGMQNIVLRTIANDLGVRRYGRDSSLRFYFQRFARMFAIQGHIQPIYCALFDRTGTRIITGSDDFLVKIWNADTGWLIHTLRGHTNVIVDIAVNVENTLVAAASLDNTVRVWNLRTAEPIAVLQGPLTGRKETKGFTGVTFSPGPLANMRYLVATGVDGMTRLWRWDLETLEFSKEPILLYCRVLQKDEVRCYSFNFSGTRFCVGGTDGLVRLFAIDPDSGEVRGPVVLGQDGTGHTGHVTSVSHSNDGEMILSGSMDGTVRIWRYIAEPFRPIRWEQHVIDIQKFAAVEPKEPVPPEVAAPADLPPAPRLSPPPAFPPVGGNRMDPIVLDDEDIEMVARRADTEGSVHESEAQGCVVGEPGAGPSTTATLPILSPDGITGESTGNAGGVPEPRARASDPTEGNPDMDTTRSSLNPNHRAHNLADVGGGGSHGDGGLDMDENRTEPDEDGLSSPPPANAMSGVVSTPLPLVEPELEHSVGIGPPSAEGGPATAPPRLLRQTRANRTTSRSVPRRSSAGVGQERADRAMSEMRSRLRSRNTGTGAENPPEEPAPAPVADPEPEPELQMEEPPAGSVPDDAAQGSIAQQRARNAQQQADRIKVTMTAWSKDDSRIVVASTDHILRTFDSRRGELLCTMKQHDDEIYVIDIHPVDARIFLSAGHDGQLILWDIITGRALKTLLCDFSVLEARFSQDGMRIVAVDSMGYTHLFSAMDDLVVYQGVATEQFFPSDYNPLRMDANQWVVDEQMQIAPHLMPRVPVSSYFGVPWPAAVGRETEGLDAPTGLERGELEDELQRRLAQVEKERTKRQPVPHLHEDATRMEKEAKSLKRKLERQRRRGRGGTDFYSDDEQLLMFLDSPVAPLPESSEDEYGDQDTSSDEGSAGFDGNGSDSSGAAGQGRRTRRRRETRAQRRERRNRRRLRSQRGSDFDRSDQVGDDFRALDLDFLSDAEAEALGLRRRKNKKSYREVDSSGLDEGGDSDGAFELDGEGLSSRRRKRRRPTAGSSSAADATSSSVLPAAASTSTAPAPYPYPTKGKRKSRKGDFDFDPDAYLPTDWVSEVRPTDTPYRPQVGDKVVYIQAGHKAWLRAVKEGVRGAHGEYEVYPEPPDLVNRVTRELPWERKTANYPPIVFGVVKKIEYHVAPPAICRVDIEIHENTAASDNPEARSPANSDWSIQVLPPVESLTPTTSVLKVVYFDKDDCADFLVLFDRYMAGMSTTFQMGDPVLVRYSDGEEHEGLLVAKYAADGTLLAGEEPTLPKQRRTRLRPTGDPSSSATPMGGAAAPSASRSETHAQSRSESALSDPWSCFRVLWAEGNVEAFSPWELFKPGHPPPPLPRIDADEATAIMNAILRFAEDERHAVFVDPVNREDYPDYFRYIAYPMHLSMLVERLQNGFYRRFEALVWDIDRIRVNAMIYNDSDTDVYQLANIELKKLIEQVQAAREGRDRRLMTLRLRASNGPASGAPSVVSDSDAGSATGTAKRAITLTMRSTFSGSGSAEPRDESLEQGRRTRSSQATIAKSPQQEFVDNVPSESRSNLDGPGGHNLRSARSRAHVESVAAAAPLPAPRPARRILIRSGSAASNAGNNLRTGPNGTDFGAGSPRRPAAAESKATVFPMRSTRRSKEAQASEQMERVSDSDVDAGRKRTKTRSTPRRTLRIGSAGTEGMVPASPFLEPTETGHRDDAHTDDREDLPNDEFGDGGTDGQPRSEAGPVYEPPPPKPKAPRKRRSSDSDEPSDFEAGPDSAPSGASDEESSELSSVESDSDQARRKKKSSKAKRTAQKRTPARKRRKLVYSEESEESSAVETDDS